MPTKRKRRTRGRRPDVELKKAMHFYFLAGREADCLTRHGVRLRGWLDLYAVLAHDLGRLEVLWAAHRVELVAEANEHGFVPLAMNWFTKDGRLRDDADDVVAPDDGDSPRATWSRTFLETHAY